MFPRVRTWSFFAVALLAGSSSCSTFDDLSACESNGDCARGWVCDEKKFCTSALPVIVGVTLPLSGSFSAIGADARQAIEYVESVVNASERVRKRGIEFRILDDSSDADTARRNVETLISQGAIAIIGPMTSSQAVKAQEVSFAKKTVHLTPYAGAQILGDIQPAGDRYFFQAITNIERGSGSTIVLKMQEAKCTDVVTVRSDDTTGSDYARVVRENVPKASGICVASDLPIATAEKASYADEVGKIESALKGKSVPCATLVVAPPIAGKILRDAAGRIPGMKWFGPSALHTASFIDAAKAAPGDTTTSAEGTYVADIRVEQTEVGWLQDAYAKVNPSTKKLSNFFLFTFDAALVLSFALELADSLEDPTSLRDALVRAGKNDGTDGEITFSPRKLIGTGDNGFGLALTEIRQKKLRDLNYDGVTGPLEFDEHGVVGNNMEEWIVRGTAFASDSAYSSEQILTMLAAAPKATCP